MGGRLLSNDKVIPDDIYKNSEHIHEFELYSENVRLNEPAAEISSKIPNREEHVYSVTAIENYVNCPYQFFAGRLLRLEFIWIK